MTMYRCIKLRYPGIDPILILEYKNGEWHQMFSTMDREFFARYVRKMHMTLSETLEVDGDA
jgi:hypothetical protein